MIGEQSSFANAHAQQLFQPAIAHDALKALSQQQSLTAPAMCLTTLYNQTAHFTALDLPSYSHPLLSV